MRGENSQEIRRAEVAHTSRKFQAVNAHVTRLPNYPTWHLALDWIILYSLILKNQLRTRQFLVILLVSGCIIAPFGTPYRNPKFLCKLLYKVQCSALGIAEYRAGAERSEQSSICSLLASFGNDLSVPARFGCSVRQICRE